MFDLRRSCHPGDKPLRPFNTEKLRFDGGRSAERSVVDALQSCLVQNLGHFQPDLLSMDEQWTALRDSLLSSGESVLGRCRRLQPDWYRDSCSTLDPLLEQRNQAYTAWVASGHQSERLYCVFHRYRRESRAAIRRAKASWFQSKALEAERSRFDGAGVWKCIRHLQQATRGLVPTRLTSVKDESGHVCSTVEKQH